MGLKAGWQFPGSLGYSKVKARGLASVVKEFPLLKSTL
jgi:hypothetical protein